MNKELWLSVHKSECVQMSTDVSRILEKWTRVLEMACQEPISTSPYG